MHHETRTGKTLAEEAAIITKSNVSGRYALYNGIVYTPWEKFYGGLIVNGTIIEQVFRGNIPEAFTGESIKKLNCHDALIIPGLVDLHLHGAKGFDFTVASTEEIVQAINYHASHGGTTTLLPTLVSAPLEQIKKAVTRIRKARLKLDGPCLSGVHIEGPFLNPRYKGAHMEAYLKNPAPAIIEDIISSMGDILNMVTLSPELPHALAAITRLTDNGIIAAAGHSGATFEKTEEAISYGLKHVVHTFSAMRRFHHRSPGILGAALTLDNLSSEIIADGVHTHRAAVKLLFQVKPPAKVILVTDALAVCGLPDQICQLGDKKIISQGGKAFLEDGTLAGSILTMNRALAGAFNMSGLSLERILPAATINPARLLGISNYTGSLERGKKADITIINNSFEVLLTIAQGKPLLTALN